MPGIKVEMKRGQRWWYVVADFGDGTPVSKGPMTEEDARAMVADLESGAVEADGVVVRDASLEEAAANRRTAITFIVALLILVLLGTAFVAFVVIR